jgi:hypothetical protein
MFAGLVPKGIERVEEEMADRVADPRGQRTPYAAGAVWLARIDEHLLDAGSCA